MELTKKQFAKIEPGKWLQNRGFFQLIEQINWYFNGGFHETF
jgi:hypothetical protein